jgi:phage terminase large subunit-like protein
MNQKLFVVTETGNLWERVWNAGASEWVWFDHGRPGNQKIVHAPGAAMMNQKLFVVTETGNLWERVWNAGASEWVWFDHGRPGNQKIVHAPGAAMMNQKLFVVTETGNLWERNWSNDVGQWGWQDHGMPTGTSVATAPGAAMLDSKLFVGTANSHLFERVWDGKEWIWVDHGTAYHDQAAHVIGAPGDSPALTVAVMGDGFDEGSIQTYRNLVHDNVVSAFHLDQLGNHQDKLRVVRIDVISPVDGVTERRYDEHGTTDTAADDTLISEDFKFSRLGMIGTGVWSHCWIETSPRTIPRINSIRNQFAPEATNIIVLVNSPTQGGCTRGNIAAFTRGEPQTTIAHELGHNIFGLGDEYHEGKLAFTGVAGPPNLSETPSPWTALKWDTLVAAGAPLPTDSGALPGGWNDNTSVGAFEGGGGNFATGIFRPVLRCRMNQNKPPWCPVCGQVIDVFFGAL